MGWVRQPPHPHTCRLPDGNHTTRGSLWRCDHCNRPWRFGRPFMVPGDRSWDTWHRAWWWTRLQHWWKGA